jgi:hypothetical protein
MATIYTVRLAAASFSTTGPHLLFTARTGVTTVVRDVVASNQSTVATNIWLYVLANGTDAVLIYSENVASLLATPRDMRQVILPGESVFTNSQIAPWTVAVTGFEFV